MHKLALLIESAWDEINESKTPDEVELIKKNVNLVLQQLDTGQIRIAEKDTEGWQVNQWIKKAILLYFKYAQNNVMMEVGIHYDKVPLKFTNFTSKKFKSIGARIVPGAIVRYGSYLANKVIVMPSFINIGAYIDEGTLIDTWATIGSCAQIGKDCHISGGAGIGGVLEPLQASPVIIEDNVFIGARSEVVDGVIIERGSVLSMGVFIGSSTKIYDRMTGETLYGRVPAYSVVVPGTTLSSDGKTQTYAAIIVKKVDAKTRQKTSLNELLRH